MLTLTQCANNLGKSSLGSLTHPLPLQCLLGSPPLPGRWVNGSFHLVGSYPAGRFWGSSRRLWALFTGGRGSLPVWNQHLERFRGGSDQSMVMLGQRFTIWPLGKSVHIAPTVSVSVCSTAILRRPGKCPIGNPFTLCPYPSG